MRLLLLLVSALSVIAAPAVDRAALMSAVSADDADAIHQALKANPDALNSQDEATGRTALMSAALGGMARAAATLVAAGADWNIPENDGYTPLHGAGFQGHAGVVNVLMSAGVPHELHSDGFGPIHRACWGTTARHAEAVQAFITHGVSVDLPTAQGVSPFQLAAKAGNEATISVIKHAHRAALHVDL
jgi:ankyrin repeat protein